MFVGGMLNKLGRPQKAMVNSLLSPAPVGFWHLTVGNPFHPIMSLGNMILLNTEIEHYGPLGLDDFPTGIKVTCTLTRGKPRDLRDIEKIYMHGNDRIYSSMSDKVIDMYKNADIYKREYNTTVITEETGGDYQVITSKDGEPDIFAQSIGSSTISAGIMNKLQKYFGSRDAYAVFVTANEQEYGAHKKPPKDSSDTNA
jgi:hypothetical protein